MAQGRRQKNYRSTHQSKVVDTPADEKVLRNAERISAQGGLEARQMVERHRAIIEEKQKKTSEESN
jgi:hypothetical protein